MVGQADLVLAMGERHLTRVEELGGAGKSFLLTDFASNGERVRGVADPFGGDLSAYRVTFAELEREVRRALADVDPAVKAQARFKLRRLEQLAELSRAALGVLRCAAVLLDKALYLFKAGDNLFLARGAAALFFRPRELFEFGAKLVEVEVTHSGPRP